MNEKERVYEELDQTRKKLAKVKGEVRKLNRAMSRSETTKLRAERDRLCKALSWIAYSPEAPDDAAYLKAAAQRTLEGPDPRTSTRSGRAAVRAERAAEDQALAVRLEARP